MSSTVRSVDRILTTHSGSLARPEALEDTLMQRGDAEGAAVKQMVHDAVSDVVARQVELGLDIVSDGEMSKTGFFTYVSERLGGLDSHELSHEGALPELVEGDDFPQWLAEFQARWAATTRNPRIPACVDDLTYENRDPLEADIANFADACAKHAPSAGFMTAISPGFLSNSVENRHYGSHEEFVWAIGAAMKTEYEAIHQAGHVLQLDCPDLTTWGRTRAREGETFEDWRRVTIQSVEALNDATRDIPADAMRIHVCWANYPGPHHHDVALRDIVDILFRARPAGLSIEAANPRHEHEWAVFEDVKLPDGKVLIPGVVDSTSAFIEHPELVAQRIINFARVVGRENVIAGTDCGFASMAAWITVDPGIAYAKLRSVVEGAQLSSDKLWKD
jgi:5-methyltetrahydropteroyltriglutamate--homocysteine methyltransferase